MSERCCHFHCRFGEAGGIPMLAVVGDLDTATAGGFRQAVRFHTGADPRGCLILDLSRVSFLDTEGLRALLATRDDLPNRLALAGVGSAVRRVFEVTGVERLFLVADSPEAAARLLSRESYPERNGAVP